MNIEKDIVYYEDRLRDITDIAELVNIGEDILREVTSLDHIAILNVVDRGARLYSHRLDNSIDISYDRYAITAECYYTKRVHHIKDATRSFLYDRDIDNIFDIDIGEIMVIPVMEKLEEVLAIVYITSIESIDIPTDDIASIIHLISHNISLITRDKLLVDSTINILLVDDSIIILKYIASILKRYNTKIHAAICGADAIECFKSSRIDIILIEEILGVGGRLGHQIIDDIRKIEIDRGQDPIPILGITSDTSRDSRDRLLNSGANSILYKPIEPDEVITALRQFIVLESGDIEI